MNWLRRLFHLHRWEVMGQGNIMGTGGQIAGVYYMLRCQECGDLKCRRFE